MAKPARSKEIDDAVNHVGEEIHAAWAYFNLLQGMHKGSLAHPNVLEEFASLFDQLWRAVFNALISAVGTVLDRTAGGISLHNLMSAIRRDPALGLSMKHDLADIERQLRREGGPVKKLRNWRHKLVAHRTQEGRGDDFHEQNKMHLPDVNEALVELEGYLYRLALGSLSIHVLSSRADTLRLQIDGESMFEAIAKSIEHGGTDGPG